MAAVLGVARGRAVLFRGEERGLLAGLKVGLQTSCYVEHRIAGGLELLAGHAMVPQKALAGEVGAFERAQGARVEVENVGVKPVQPELHKGLLLHRLEQGPAEASVPVVCTADEELHLSPIVDTIDVHQVDVARVPATRPARVQGDVLSRSHPLQPARMTFAVGRCGGADEPTQVGVLEPGEGPRVVLVVVGPELHAQSAHRRHDPTILSTAAITSSASASLMPG